VVVIAIASGHTATGQVAPAPPSSGLAALDARWSLALGSPLSATPAFDAQTAYVPTRNGQLAAVELDSGFVRWRIDLETAVSPASGDGLVFATSTGLLMGLDSASGRPLWRTPLAGRVVAPLYWDSGWLIASMESGDVTAYRADAGTLVWTQNLGAPLALAPVPALDRLFFALTDSRLISADLDTGVVRWTETVEGRISGLLALDDQLIAGTTGNFVQSFELTNGRRRWRWRVGADVVGSGAADDGFIYFVALDNVLRAVDRRSGNLRWSRPLPARPSTGPVRVDDAVLVPFVSSEIAVFSPADGKPIVTIKGIGELGAQPYLRSNPAPTAARLITVNREGTLQGFASRMEPPPAPLETLPGARVGGDGG
ncbi:MAG: PQQ-binding-like beta-propeller repeat protein, partial [Acidobacteria bacterium]|nr:PQQ-binding-like beta-propeller repeat protein [Acidobacteriota bacterium]